MNELAAIARGLPLAADDLEREFEARLSESSTLAFRVAYSVLRHREDAEDVAQNAFINAHRHFHRLRDRDRFKAWLVRMTWRLALNRARADRRRGAREEVPPGQQPSVNAEDIVVSNERAVHLWRAIDALPPKLRETVVLASIEGHGVSDVARLLGVAEGTVKSRLFHARERLAEKLQCIAGDWTR
jgi:RNA polymerase sigma-70 factor (ECF subfamily)